MPQLYPGHTDNDIKSVTSEQQDKELSEGFSSTNDEKKDSYGVSVDKVIPDLSSSEVEEKGVPELGDITL